MRSPDFKMAATTATLVPCQRSFRSLIPSWALNLSLCTNMKTFNILDNLVSLKVMTDSVPKYLSNFVQMYKLSHTLQPFSDTRLFKVNRYNRMNCLALSHTMPFFYQEPSTLCPNIPLNWNPCLTTFLPTEISHFPLWSQLVFIAPPFIQCCVCVCVCVHQEFDCTL